MYLTIPLMVIIMTPITMALILAISNPMEPVHLPYLILMIILALIMSSKEVSAILVSAIHVSAIQMIRLTSRPYARLKNKLKGNVMSLQQKLKNLIVLIRVMYQKMMMFMKTTLLRLVKIFRT